MDQLILSFHLHIQAHKFLGVNDDEARNCVEAIRSAKSPEEAARMGRKMQRQHPDLVCFQIPLSASYLIVQPFVVFICNLQFVVELLLGSSGNYICKLFRKVK